MQYIGIIASLVCAVYAFKTFEQAEKIAKIQDQKEKDKEADFRLNEIVKFFLERYFFYIYKDLEGIGDSAGYFFRPEHKPECDRDKQVEWLLKEYTFRYTNYNIETKERKLLKEIFYKIIFPESIMFLRFFMSSNGWGLVCEEDALTKKDIEEKLKTFNINKGSAKTMNLDYNILEKIYNTIFLKNHDN